MTRSSRDAMRRRGSGRGGTARLAAAVGDVVAGLGGGGSGRAPGRGTQPGAAAVAAATLLSTLEVTDAAEADAGRTRGLAFAAGVGAAAMAYATPAEAIACGEAAAEAVPDGVGLVVPPAFPEPGDVEAAYNALEPPIRTIVDEAVERVEGDPDVMGRVSDSAGIRTSLIELLSCCEVSGGQDDCTRTLVDAVVGNLEMASRSRIGGSVAEYAMWHAGDAVAAHGGHRLRLKEGEPAARLWLAAVAALRETAMHPDLVIKRFAGAVPPPMAAVGPGGEGR